MRVELRENYVSTAAAKAAWIAKKAELDALIENEVDAREAALQAAINEHMIAIKRMAEFDLYQNLEAKQKQLLTAFEAQNLAADHAIILKLKEMQDAQSSYANMQIEDNREYAVEYLLNEMTLAPDANEAAAAPIAADALGGVAVDVPAAAPARRSRKNPADELIDEGRTLVNKEHPYLVTRYKNNTLYSTSPIDFAIAWAARGWSKCMLTKAPVNHPVRILHTMAALIDEGVHVTVSPAIRALLNEKLTSEEKQRFLVLEDLSACVKTAQSAENNTVFDETSQSLHTKIFLEANKRPSANALHKEQLTRLAKWKDHGHTVIQTLIRQVKASGAELKINGTLIAEPEDYINQVLPKESIETLKPLTSNEFITAFNNPPAEAGVTTAAIRKRNLVKLLAGDYATNNMAIEGAFAIIHNMPLPERVALLKELHTHYLEAEKTADPEFKKILAESWTGILFAPKQPSKELAMAFPPLAHSLSPAETLSLTEDLRTASIAKLAPVDPATADARWREFLAERKFFNGYYTINNDIKSAATEAFTAKLAEKKANPDITVSAKYFISHAPSFIAENSGALLNDDIRLAIIREYAAMYNANPSPTALKYITSNIKLMLKSMIETEKVGPLLVVMAEVEGAIPATKPIIDDMRQAMIKHSKNTEKNSLAKIDTLDNAVDQAAHLETRITYYAYLVNQASSPRDKEKVVDHFKHEMLEVANKHKLEPVYTIVTLNRNEEFTWLLGEAKSIYINPVPAGPGR